MVAGGIAVIRSRLVDFSEFCTLQCKRSGSLSFGGRYGFIFILAEAGIVCCNSALVVRRKATTVTKMLDVLQTIHSICPVLP